MKRLTLSAALALGFITPLNLSPSALSNEPSGTWQTINEQTLRFVGQIDERTAVGFNRVITPQTRTIIVQSGGGDVVYALQVGKEIHRRQLNIIVDGRCGSSCANYWFLAAANKTVQKGSWVGFHGNLSSSYPYYDPKQFDPEFLKFLADFDKEERAFFKALDIDIELVQKSSTITVAFQQPVYLPSPEQLGCFGVSNLNMWYPRRTEEKALLWGAGGNVVLTQDVEDKPELSDTLCKSRQTLRTNE